MSRKPGIFIRSFSSVWFGIGDGVARIILGHGDQVAIVDDSEGEPGQHRRGLPAWPDGELLVDGLATEIITLAGSFLPGANGSVQASTSAVVVDRHDQVYAGPLIRGHDPSP